MKALLITALAIVAILAFAVVTILIVGSNLPATHTVSRSIKLKAPPQEIYNVVRDFGSAAEWRPDIERVDVAYADGGAIRFRESGSNGTINYELVEDVPGRLIVTRIVDTDLGFGGSWTYELTPDAAGTLVTITENGEVPNVFFRFMLRYVFGYSSTIDGYLDALAARVGDR